MDANFDAILRKWDFRPISTDGKVMTDGEPITPAVQPQPEPSEKTREIAKKILDTPDVKL